MPEEAFDRHINDLLAQGEALSVPDDPDSRALAGTALLARIALLNPAPPAQSEEQSREQVLTQLRESKLSPRLLRETSLTVRHPSLLTRLRRWLGKE